jgi:Flp pilus assembly protein TadD
MLNRVAPSRFRSRLVSSTCVMLAILSVAGCASSPSKMTTGSIPTRLDKPVDTMSEQELSAAARSIGAAYERNPKDRNTGLSYANILMMTGRQQQALAVMQQVAIANPSDREVLAAFGKAQAAAGQLEQALSTIGRAQLRDRPDWKLFSAEGAVLDQLGRSEEARGRYRMALDIQPNEPSVLSNLGMSYVLSGDLRTAETYLKSASQQPSADSRVRQNLALVVGLQGRFDEAEKIARSELTQEQANANVTYLRSMLAQQNNWKKLAGNETASAAGTN